MAKYFCLIEKRKKGTPRVWLVDCEIEPVEGGQVCFEFGYLANGFGASYAILVPSGKDYPRIQIAMPHTVRNMVNGMVLAKGSYFTIEKIDYGATL